MEQHLRIPQSRLLKRLMSELSEDYICAGWYVGTEYSLWADLTGVDSVCGDRAWHVPPDSREELALLHELAGGWVVFSEADMEHRFLTTSEWLHHLATRDKNFLRATSTHRQFQHCAYPIQ